jgi:dienelactone hydrolase
MFALANPLLLATEIKDLERDTPVPGNEPVPVLDFFRPPVLQEPRLNPSGTHIAALVSVGEDHTRLLVHELKTQKNEIVGAKGDADIYNVYWLNDRRLIYGISVKKGGGIGLIAGEVGNLDNSYPLEQYVGSSLIAIPPKDRTHPLVRLAPQSINTGPYGEVVNLNSSLTSGLVLDLSVPGQGESLPATIENNLRHVYKRHPILKTVPNFDVGYFADKEGELAFGLVSDDGIVTLHQLVGEAWVKCPEDLDQIEVIGCGDNPGEIVVLGPRAGGKPRPLEVMEAATGKVVEVLIQDKAYDCIPWLYRDPVSHNIVGAIYTRAGPHVVWFSEGYRNLQKLVDGSFPGQVARIIGNDEAGKMVLISTFSDRQPAVYSWVDLEKHGLGLFKSSSPWIDPKRMQPMSVIKYTTRDGRQLDAYVTMPAGATRQNPPPLVVLPPSAKGERNSWGYDAEVQFLASRGYAVLQPNHRGSAGYSWMFPLEDEWAFRKMHEDVTEATKTMLASGLVDRTRVAIMGTGFGGFLALSGAAYEPSLYRCVVAVSPVSDWGRLIADYKHDKFFDPFYSRIVRKMGDPGKDPEKWDAIAPLRHADQIRAPGLIAMGEYDPPMDLVGSKNVASAMERNHVPVETMSFWDEAGGPRRLADIVELQTHLETFLAKYLKPVGPAIFAPAATP